MTGTSDEKLHPQRREAMNVSAENNEYPLDTDASVLASVAADTEAVAVGLASLGDMPGAKAALQHIRAALGILYQAVDTALATDGEPVTRERLLDRWRTLGFTSGDGFLSTDLDRSLIRALDHPDETDAAATTS
jgi:hypothetical protein